MTVRIGARRDDPVQDDRIRRAFAAGTVDYIEADYPVPYGDDLTRLRSTAARNRWHGVGGSGSGPVAGQQDVIGTPWIRCFSS